MASIISRFCSRLFFGLGTKVVPTNKYFKPCKLFVLGSEQPFEQSIQIKCFNNGQIDLAPNPFIVKRIERMQKIYPTKNYYIDPKHLADPQNWHS